MTKFSVERPIYGRLGEVIESNHPDYVERLSAPELREGIRAGFRTADCFSMLSKLNRQLRICREAVDKHRSARNR
ncbi:hypothetical protein [Janthinobacterium sp. CAN_S7]|uniref:hypothetical protein n=1 Tax=Janthinobacterium sp. CAN_S7 TaxID=3071704 RepID=UPI00319EA83E